MKLDDLDGKHLKIIHILVLKKNKLISLNFWLISKYSLKWDKIF
jgi:hypothetical protein